MITEEKPKTDALNKLKEILQLDNLKERDSNVWTIGIPDLPISNKTFDYLEKITNNSNNNTITIDKIIKLRKKYNEMMNEYYDIIKYLYLDVN